MTGFPEDHHSAQKPPRSSKIHTSQHTTSNMLEKVEVLFHSFGISSQKPSILPTVYPVWSGRLLLYESLKAGLFTAGYAQLCRFRIQISLKSSASPSKATILRLDSPHQNQAIRQSK